MATSKKTGATGTTESTSASNSFGSFKVRQSAARKGVNPRDRKPIEVPAKERVRFFPGKELADAVLKK